MRRRIKLFSVALAKLNLLLIGKRNSRKTILKLLEVAIIYMFFLFSKRREHKDDDDDGDDDNDDDDGRHTISFFLLARVSAQSWLSDYFTLNFNPNQVKRFIIQLIHIIDFLY